MSREVLKQQMNHNLHVLQANVAGITHEESLAAPSPAGNSMNWVVRHVVSSRNQFVHPALGISAPQGDGGESEEPVPLDALLSELRASQQAVLAAIDELPEDGLAKLVEGPQGPTTLEAALAGLVFHEAYHVGQTGLLRRLLGKKGAIA